MTRTETLLAVAMTLIVAASSVLSLTAAPSTHLLGYHGFVRASPPAALCQDRPLRGATPGVLYSRTELGGIHLQCCAVRVPNR